MTAYREMEHYGLRIKRQGLDSTRGQKLSLRDVHVSLGAQPPHTFDTWRAFPDLTPTL